MRENLTGYLQHDTPDTSHGLLSTFKQSSNITVVKLQGVVEGVTKVSYASTILLLKWIDSYTYTVV